MESEYATVQYLAKDTITQARRIIKNNPREELSRQVVRDLVFLSRALGLDHEASGITELQGWFIRVINELLDKSNLLIVVCLWFIYVSVTDAVAEEESGSKVELNIFARTVPGSRDETIDRIKEIFAEVTYNLSLENLS